MEKRISVVKQLTSRRCGGGFVGSRGGVEEERKTRLSVWDTRCLMGVSHYKLEGCPLILVGSPAVGRARDIR